MCFVKDFSTLVSPLNEVVKKSVGFKSGEAKNQLFSFLKEKLCSTPVLTLPNFMKSFEIESDASEIEIGDVLIQDRRSIFYFTEKLS
jgi:hypothetical protein